MQIDVFSDTVCPWCLIGKRRLEQALAKRPQSDLQITWRTFQLNPEMPMEGMDRQTYLTRKFGGEQNAATLYGRIKQVGDEENIPFKFESIKRTPNTLDSHRLIRFAAIKGYSDEVVEALFEAYFFQGRDIGDRAVLQEIGVTAGLNETEVAEFLAGDEFLEEIRSEDTVARRMGIQGVPCFSFNGRHVLSGAQPVEVFWQMFDVVRADENSQPQNAEALKSPSEN